MGEAMSSGPISVRKKILTLAQYGDLADVPLEVEGGPTSPIRKPRCLQDRGSTWRSLPNYHRQRLRFMPLERFRPLPISIQYLQRVRQEHLRPPPRALIENASQK